MPLWGWKLIYKLWSSIHYGANTMLEKRCHSWSTIRDFYCPTLQCIFDIQTEPAESATDHTLYARWWQLKYEKLISELQQILHQVLKMMDFTFHLLANFQCISAKAWAWAFISCSVLNLKYNTKTLNGGIQFLNTAAVELGTKPHTYRNTTKVSVET